MKKREATSIVWYLGKCFAGFRNLGKSVFLDGIMMCVPEWLFGVMTFWNDETFWVFKMKKREVASIVWYLEKCFVGFRNLGKSVFLDGNNDVRSIMTFWRTDILKRRMFLGFEILKKRGSLYFIRFLCINKVFNVFRWIFYYWFRYKYIQYNFINGASLRAHKGTVYQTTT